MAAKVLHKERAGDLLDRLADRYRVIVPCREDGVTIYGEYDPGRELDLTNRPVQSAKGVLFPQAETLFEFERGRQQAEVRDCAGDDVQESVIFGIRPCDIHGIKLLETVFTDAYSDPYFSRRMEKTILVGIACTEPLPSCFCTSFGYGPWDSSGADVFLYDIGDSFVWRSLTGRGEEMTAGLAYEWDEVPEAGDVEKRLRSGREKALARIRKLDIPSDLAGRMMDAFHSPYWQKLSQSCLGCGICTYLCPTCHCFDIHDLRRGGGGERYRCWDSCMFSNFTLAAGDHNPRPTREERVRQRMMHKLSYSVERYDQYLCVGCGRCVDMCPAGIDIRQVVMDFAGEGAALEGVNAGGE